MASTEFTLEQASQRCNDLIDEIETAVIADRSFLETVLLGVLSRGHVLLEDVPGTGKTLTARSFATALDLSFSRIQFTPDLLPADVTGTHIYNEQDNSFEFNKGPIFANVILADEINRAPPKTQAAMLEAMGEGQVTVEGETRQLPRPFFVIATQNPVEQEGTFRLPEAQRDRFSVKTSLGYADIEGEMELLERRANRRTLAPSVDPVTDAETVLGLQEAAEDVRVDEKIRRYIIQVARATRADTRTEIGVSPDAPEGARQGSVPQSQGADGQQPPQGNQQGRQQRQQQPQQQQPRQQRNQQPRNQQSGNQRQPGNQQRPRNSPQQDQQQPRDHDGASGQPREDERNS